MRTYSDAPNSKCPGFSRKLTGRTSLVKRRSGTILAVALILLTVVMLLSAALAKRMLVFHQQEKLDESRLQAMWLVESGCQRALRAADASSDYRGETWHIPAGVSGSGASGVVTIRVEMPSAPATERIVTVTATYPENAARRFVLKREILFTPRKTVTPENRSPEPSS